MRQILLAILCITIFAVPPEPVIFEAWTHYEIDVQERPYPFSAETNATYDAFKANYIALDAFITDSKGATYDLGLNLFSDISQTAFATAHLLQGITPYQNAKGLDTSALPATKSWQNVIFEEALQETGPDSWAYAAVAATEAFFNRKITDPANYIHLSVQQVIDCVTTKTPFGALTWISTNGIDLQADYTQGVCAPKTAEHKIPEIRLVQADGDEVKAALQFTPVTVCFDLSNFQQYKNGVINQDCDETKLNYCGLLYGYEGDEWIIKTSLGTAWGVEGQVRIHHGALCGVSKVAAFPMLMNEDIESFRDNFNAFKTKFAKTYATQEEEEKRFKIYANAIIDGGHFVGETQFTDLTADEFKAKYLLNGITMNDQFKLDDYLITVDGDIDWRDQQIVTQVVDQGDCKSSWAIASKNAFETYFRQQTSKYVQLSLQQVIDCSDPLLPKQGCSNGSPSHALQYGTVNGLIWESKYPFVGQAQDCQQVQGATLRPTNFVKLTDVNTIAASLKKRPVVVCFTASNLQNYVSQVITQADCGADANNYCGLLVGKTQEYWIVQGSFGTTWGIDGYVHIQYGNNCGITNNAYAII